MSKRGVWTVLGDGAIALTPLILLMVVVSEPTPLMYVVAMVGGLAALAIWMKNREGADE